MTRVTVRTQNPSAQTGTSSAAPQSRVNAGSGSGYVTPTTLQDKDDDVVALTDAATIDITGPKHTLATTTGRTFTISHTGDCIIIDITLSATSVTFTFPATALCVYVLPGVSSVASGDNTMAVTATSGDRISIGIIKIGNDYRVTGINFGQQDA